MLPDVSGIDKVFDYRVPDSLDDRVACGAIVKVRLHGRAVRGWVVADPVEPPDGIEIRDVAELSSLGPPPEVVDLAKWAAWRYAGRLRPFLLAGSAARRVRELPAQRRSPRPTHRRAGTLESGDAELGSLVEKALGHGVAVLRLAPATGRFAVVAHAADTIGARDGARDGDLGDLLVIVPTRAEATRLVALLEKDGRPAALIPEQWPSAAAGGVVAVGTRNATFAPLPRLGAVLVLDAHSEALTETRAPTWNAAVVATERARAAGVPAVLVSPCPTLDLLAGSELVVTGRAAERNGWAPLEVIDRRGDDPRSGLYSETAIVRARAALATGAGRGRPVVFILNRTGTARVVRCGTCGSLARCENCGAGLAKAASSNLVCPRGCAPQPPICPECGSGRLKLHALGTKRVASDLGALLGVPVAEVTGGDDRVAAANTAAGAAAPLDPAAQVVAGTEAALHRVPSASLVVFLDFDLELASPRLRGEENALSLLAYASRVVGGRRRDGRVLVQTRIPDHEVLAAALSADPGLVSGPERERRARLRLPPYGALALLTGPEAGRLAQHLEAENQLEAAETERGFLVRAPDEQALCDALGAARPLEADVRIEVDPLRL